MSARSPPGRCVARLRELNALLGHSFENLQRDLLIERSEGCSVRWTITVADRNQHGVVAKADPHRRWMRGIAAFVVLQDARHERSKTANPVRWRIAPQSQNLLPLQRTLLAQFLGVEPGHLVVRDAHDMATRVSNAC